MATRRWLGTAAATAQVDTFTPANVEIGDTFTLTATAEDGTTTVDIAFVATAATVANVTAGLTAAWNASTNTLCTGVTAADQTTTMKLTADTAGVPFHVTSAATNGGAADTQTLTRAATKANSGPNAFNVAANWSGAAVPTDADDVVIEDSTVDILYDLYQPDIELASLTIKQNYTGYIGTTDAYLRIDATAVSIGQQAGTTTQAGSRRIKLDMGDTESTVNIHNTATSAVDTYQMPTRLLFNKNTSVLHVHKGKVGIASEDSSETSTLAAINIGEYGGKSTDAEVVIGSGVTLTTLTKVNGYAALQCAATTVTNTGGTLETLGSGAITTLNTKGGLVYSDSSGTITNLNIYGGTTDFTRSSVARTVTNCTLYAGSSEGLKYDSAVVTMTNKVTVSGIASITATVV